jgi:hypothetical protein
MIVRQDELREGDWLDVAAEDVACGAGASSGWWWDYGRRDREDARAKGFAIARDSLWKTAFAQSTTEGAIGFVDLVRCSGDCEMTEQEKETRQRWRGPSLKTLISQAKAAGLTVTSAISRADGRVELQFAPQVNDELPTSS